MHIWYEVHVFVKYDAWNDFGSGKFVSFPILIMPNAPDTSKRSSEGFTHANWGPNSSNSGVDFSARRQPAHTSVGLNNDLAIRYTMGVMMSPEELANQMMQSSEQYADIVEDDQNDEENSVEEA